MASHRLLGKTLGFLVDLKPISLLISRHGRVFNEKNRFYSTQENGPSKLWSDYNAAKALCETEVLPADIDPDSVFVSNELDLNNISVYGYDYDYTLACYHESLHYLIYNLAKEALVTKFNYPKAISNLNFTSQYAIRGLHYDIHKGLLMKLDSFHQIQLGSVYKGLTAVKDDKVLSIYKNITLPKKYVDGPHENGKDAPMKHLIDLFSLPEVMLLLNIQTYFDDSDISYAPDILFWDVRNAVQSIHPMMHGIVEAHISDYLLENKSLRRYFEKLIKAGKKLFLITNSPFSFTNIGLCYLVGPDWRDLFDVVITRARKPNFFTDTSRPFRLYDVKLNSQTWESVRGLEKGKVYTEGNLKAFMEKTGWFGRRVLYFGDHVYSDLADLTLHYGWRTGAIIAELKDEINNQNSTEYKKIVLWLEHLQNLIELHQVHTDSESRQIVQEWLKERDALRQKTKAIFNPQFGSLFRTHHNPTYFSRRLFRFADIYMASINNLNKYSLHHTFYPRRGVLPHECRSKFV